MVQLNARLLVQSRRCLVHCLLFATATILSTLPARAESRVANGVLTSDFPAVGALLKTTPPGNPRILCSATLVGCETVVTAAHCVCPETYACFTAPDPLAFSVFLPQAGWFAVTSIAVHPDYSFQFGGDVAVLKLAAPVANIAPMAINLSASPPYGTPLAYVGFGTDPASGTVPGAAIASGLKRRGTADAAACHEVGADDTHLCTKFSSPLGPPGANSSIGPGDSGGAVLVDYGCGPVLGGVVSGALTLGSFSSEWLDLALSTDVFAHRDFVVAQGGGDLGMASCGAGPQVGGPGTTSSGFGGRLDDSSGDTTRPITVPPATAELRIALTVGAIVGDGDVEVLAAPGVPATELNNACALTGTVPARYCSIANPAPGPWYVHAAHRGSSRTEYQVTVTTIAASGSPPPSTDGLPCDDHQACTTGDTCAARTCGGSPAADGLPCNDDQSCTPTDSCVNGACVGSEIPRTTCAMPTRPGASRLRMEYVPPQSPGLDRFKWSWKLGDTAGFRGGGVPGYMPVDDGFALCLYDQVAGESQLVVAQLIPGDFGAWRDKSNSRGQWDELDERHRRFHGLRRLRLKDGGPGKDQFLLDGTGRDRGPLPLPIRQDPALVAQLVETASGACWEARFSTAQRNEPTRFKARSD